VISQQNQNECGKFWQEYIVEDFKTPHKSSHYYMLHSCFDSLTDSLTAIKIEICIGYMKNRPQLTKKKKQKKDSTTSTNKNELQPFFSNF